MSLVDMMLRDALPLISGLYNYSCRGPNPNLCCYARTGLRPTLMNRDVVAASIAGSSLFRDGQRCTPPLPMAMACYGCVAALRLWSARKAARSCDGRGTADIGTVVWGYKSCTYGCISYKVPYFRKLEQWLIMVIASFNRFTCMNAGDDGRNHGKKNLFSRGRIFEHGIQQKNACMVSLFHTPQNKATKSMIL